VEFDHIGIPVRDKRPGMRYLESKRHEFRVEFLWYEPDSPETELVRTTPHIAYRVDELEQAMDGYPVIAEPFDVFGEVRVSFIEVDGAPVEFVQLYE
jgi:hypothetical protein